MSQGAKRRSRHAGRDRGYTLIEMSVVLVILGIILFVMIGRVDYLLPKYRVRAGVRELASTLRLARSQAMSTGMPHYVQYDVAKGTYWILAPEPAKDPEEMDGLEDTTENAFKQYTYKWVRTMEKQLPDQVVIEKILWSADDPAEGEPVTIEVTPYGSIRRHTVWMTGTEDGAKFTISTNQVTGFVEYQEGHVQPPVLERAADQ